MLTCEIVLWVEIDMNTVVQYPQVCMQTFVIMATLKRVQELIPTYP